MSNSITFSVIRHELADQLQIVARGLSSKNLLDSINGILMESSNGKLILTTTDMEMQISSSIEHNGPDLVTFLPAQTASIIKALPGDTVKLEFTDGKVIMTAGAADESKVQLPTLDHSNFPLFGQNDSAENAVKTTVTVGELKKGLRQVLFAVSADVNKQSFTRVNFKIFADTLQLTASDTYRLSTTTCPAVRTTGEDRDMLVPAKPLQELLRSIQKLKDDDLVAITAQDRNIAFEAGSARIITRLGTESFPDVQKLIPTSFNGTMTVDTNALRQALERAMILTEKSGSSVVDLSTGETSLVGVDLCISVTSAYGSLRERIYGEYQGDGFEASFNARFLHDWLKVCEGDQVQIQHNGMYQPCVTLDSASPALKYLVLPIRKHS